MSSQKISIATSLPPGYAMHSFSLSHAKYRSLLRLGYVDAFRSLHPDLKGQFTFWNYFRQAFEHDRGIRIDHFLLPPPLADRLI
jgi:exonuclease III